MSYWPSPKQQAYLRAGIGGFVRAADRHERSRMLRLHDRGFMVRHPIDSFSFATSDRGIRILKAQATT